MAALFLEDAIANTLTLNFDAAARTALGNLGAGSQVSTIRKPEDHLELGARNLIYLHRDIDSSPDEIILRQSKLESAWRDHWEQVIAQRVLGGPVTLFVGLGTPSSVLLETTRRVLNAIGTSGTNAYVVDPIAHEESSFAKALEVASEDYICIGWGELMRELANRVVEEHRVAIEQTCNELAEKLGYENEDVSKICRRLAELGLLRLGNLRAKWFLEERYYLPHQPGNSLRLFSSLVAGVRLVEKLTDLQANFVDDGVVEFSHDNRIARVMVCSGSGWMPYGRIETELKKRQQLLRRKGKAPSGALIGGVESDAGVATPSDIVAGSEPHDLVTGPEHLTIVNIAKLRADPKLIREIVA